MKKLKKKIVWLFIILLALLFSFLILFGLFRLSGKNIYNPSPQQIPQQSYTLLIKVECQSKNTEFITEDSEMICTISAKSGNLNLSVVDVIIQIFKIDASKLEEETVRVKWGCGAKLFNVTNSTFTQPTICKNMDFDDVFRPESSGIFKVKIAKTSWIISDTGENASDDMGAFLEKDVRALSKDEEINLLISNRGLLVASLAILVNLPLLIFEFRKFLND